MAGAIKVRRQDTVAVMTWQVEFCACQGAGSSDQTTQSGHRVSSPTQFDWLMLAQQARQVAET